MIPSSSEGADNASAALDAPAEANWGAVFSLGLGCFGLVVAEFLPISLLTPISQDLGITPGTAGQTITATAIVAGIAGPLVVMATGKINRRLTLLALTLTLLISGIIGTFANTFGLLMVSRVLLGVGLGGFWSMAGAITMRLVPPADVPKAMAIVFGGVSLATVVAAPLGAWIGATFDWRAAFILAALTGLLALVVQAVTIPSLAPTGHAGFRTLVSVFKRPPVLVALFATLMLVGGQFGTFTYVRPFLEQVPQFDVELISVVLLTYGVAGFIGNFVGGAIMARSTALAIGIGSALVAVSAIILILTGANFWVSMIGVTVWGFAWGGLPVSIQTHIVRAAPDEAETAGSLMLLAFQVAISIGAVACGLILDHGGPLGVMTVLAVTMIVGCLTMFVRTSRGVQRVTA